MSAGILPFVWALAETPASPPPAPRPDLSFYRRYTEAMLRRYLRISLEAGRTPSLIGRELFRAKVSHYRMESFEDLVIFIADVERCIAKLHSRQRELIHRIALEEYTLDETASLLRLDPETVTRRYAKALDALTRIFLETRLLVLAIEPASEDWCQVEENVENLPKCTIQ